MPLHPIAINTKSKVGEGVTSRRPCLKEVIDANLSSQKPNKPKIIWEVSCKAVFNRPANVSVRM